jgi:hypothetical protein
MRVAPLLGLATALAACTGGGDYVVVTVDARAAVHDARTLSVSLSNGGTTRMDSLTLGAHPFPVTFSVSAPGRAGDLAIAVDALDEAGLIVGRGSAMTQVTADAAALRLDSADFVVNTDFAADQFPSEDFEATGFQVAALPDGTWTAAFRDSCPTSSCTIYARRFDKAGKPVSTAVAAGSNAFPLTTKPTSFASTPAIASSATTTVAVWDAYDVGGTTTSVACRALDASGQAGAAQTALSTEAADVVAVTAMANGNFVASWNATAIAPATGEQIHAAIVKPDCTPLATTPLVVSTLAGFTHRASVAASGDNVLFAWLVAGDLHVRVMSSAGVFVTSDTVLIPKTALDQIEHARVAGVPGGGFVLAARWAQIAGTTGPGRIELFRITATAGLVGAPTLVTDRSATDFDNHEAFSIASRTDGSVLVAWHTCGTLGDGSQCGVFGRILGTAGEPLSDVFGLATTTEGDQKRPSVIGLPDGFVAVWSDASAKPPDVAGQSVRARIVYPPGS